MSRPYQIATKDQQLRMAADHYNSLAMELKDTHFVLSSGHCSICLARTGSGGTLMHTFRIFSGCD
eukprot:SAG22_NODE_2832_length_2170_cov_1.074360_1_plen_64_part_10